MLYPELVRVARELGYALALHGTMTRDVDLIAVPWTDTAASALELIKALKETTSGVTHADHADEFFPDCDPKQKPHGRAAYSIHLTNRGCDGPYLDVSVMPRSS